MRTLLWFRRDLRAEDNPLLTCKDEVLPIFIFDTEILNKLQPDDRRVSFIYEAVIKLKMQLKAKGLDLALFYGKPLEIISSLLKSKKIEKIRACGDYDSYARQRDLEISRLVEFEYIHGTYIFAPDEVLKDDGTPYQVFTPFYNKAKTVFSTSHMQISVFETESSLIEFDYESIHQGEKCLHVSLSSMGFTCEVPFGCKDHGVKDLQSLLEDFSKNIGDYKEKRDIISSDYTSGLSVHLRFGTLGIKQLLRWLVERKKEGIDTEPFFRQLVFREFYASLLYHFPRVQEQNFKYHFNGVEDQKKFLAFSEAKTGVPIVDAGVQELLQTGNMHNRVRMIVASFFTKDLLLPWQWGEQFFASHLLDYDAASNILSWQWSAGTGVDPQPYFRIFNPYLQSKKFDKDASYIKRWLPELLHVSPKDLHDEEYLLHVSLQNYPKPMLSHKEASKKAIESFKVYM